MTEGKGNQKRTDYKVKTFSVPLPLEELKENSNINTHSPSKFSEEEIINQAFQYHSQGRIIEAGKCYQKLIDEGFKNYIVFSNYGDILKDQGRLEEAELSTRKAIELKPDFAEANYNLGNILRELGKLEAAELSIRKAIEIKPDFTMAHSNLGNILKSQGKLNDAELSMRKAIKLSPSFAMAHCNLGNILKSQGKLKDAELSMRKAIEINANFAMAHSNLGMIFLDLGKLEEAELSTRKAIEVNPDFVIAYYNLGNIMRQVGKYKEANIYYSIGLKKEPNNISLLISSMLNFSPVMLSNEQIDIERSSYKNHLKLINENKYLHFKGDVKFSTSIFYLAYQNRLDDKIILEELANTISNIKGIINKNFDIEKKKSSHFKKNNIKIGICSEFLSEKHTIGKLYINILLNLLKTNLEITIYVPPNRKTKSDQQIIRKNFRRVIDLPSSIIHAQEIILNDKLDIMFYPDIGMSDYTYILALSRLALVQINGLGHANTSGIKNIDYYITYGIEPISSDSQYTEKLIRFSRLPFNYSTPKVNVDNIEDKNILNQEESFNIGLTQSLFKIHPSYDKILESIVMKIKDSKLILIKDKHSHNTNILKDRWKNKHKVLLEKSIFLDRMSYEDYLNINKSCHIMLDPFYFGSGNTFYEAMTYGIPFITYPHNQKTKIPTAGYKQMKVNNAPIAKSPEDYINLCIKYANNKSLLDSTKRDLRNKAKKYLFNDNEIYKEYYHFFNEAVKKSKEQ